MKVTVSYICPPIGVRSFDWEASLDSYNGDEPNAPRGFGQTKLAALEHLLEQLDESKEAAAVWQRINEIERQW